MCPPSLSWSLPPSSSDRRAAVGHAHNADIAEDFEEIADLLEIQGANPFRIRAYRKAARTVGEFGRDIARLLAAGDAPTRLPGIGEDPVDPLPRKGGIKVRRLIAATSDDYRAIS